MSINEFSFPLYVYRTEDLCYYTAIPIGSKYIDSDSTNFSYTIIDSNSAFIARDKEELDEMHEKLAKELADKLGINPWSDIPTAICRW